MAAPAKVTLSLDVRPEPEAGWHEVDLVLYRIAAADRLELKPAAEPCFEVSGFDLTPAPENLAWRAVRLLEEIVGVSLSVRVTLEKAIPAGAGLGGGSADAAAVLRWGMAQYPEARADIQNAAERLGMDVPFLTGIAGRCARATGRGEILQALAEPEQGTLVIAYPGIPLLTKAVYAAFDAVGPVAPPATPAVVDALQARVIPFKLGNQLEHAAFHVAPDLEHFRSRLEQLGAPPERTVMSGTGSSYVVWLSDHTEAVALAAALRQAGLPFVQTEKLGKGGS
ncbi:MAG: 4-(cytidine 5'-diphospho)-2-C-methyl-D-erythritol kinase [Clostridia bacterium]